MGLSMECLPVIDLEQFSSPQDHQKLREVCKEWGCFRVVNHGVPLTLMSDMMDVARSVISLPLEIKKRVQKVVGRDGYSSHGNPNTYHDALRIYDVGSHSQAVKHFCSSLDASTMQRETVEKYCEAILQLVKTIKRKLCESLDLDGNSLEGWPLLLKINGYYMTPDIPSCNVGGPLVLHTDPSFLTILQDDEINLGGFEVMDKSGAFVQTTPSRESLIVILGEIANAWSNGHFLSAKHRIRINGDITNRVSLTSFLFPPQEETIDASSKLVDSENPRLYVPFVFKEFYRSVFFKPMASAQVLEMLRAQPEKNQLSKT